MKELPLPSVHKSVSKPAPARLPAGHPAPGRHTWLLNGLLQWWQQQGHSADIYWNISPTSRNAVHYPHFLHSPQKTRFFFSSQADWPWKKHFFSLFAQIQLLLCQLQCISYSQRKRWTWKKSTGHILGRACCIENNIDSLHSSYISLQPFWLIQILLQLLWSWIFKRKTRCLVQ